MELLKYFFQCCFNESEGFDDLDGIIERFKKKERYQNFVALIRELHQIIITENYLLADQVMREYGNRELDSPKEVERFINYLYDKFLDRPTKVKANDFAGKQCRIVLCPVCTPDPEVAPIPNVIEKATVIGKNIQIYICKYCKLVWIDENDIRADNAYDYKKFMKAKN